MSDSRTMLRRAALRDAIPLIGLGLVAGGGTAFFFFARTLFDRVPRFSPHPRYDAGEVVGPLVLTMNGLEIAVAAAVLAVAWLRRKDAAVAPRANGALLIAAMAMLAISLVERLVFLPEIVSLRESLGRSGFDGEQLSPARRRFGMLHGIDNLAQLACVALAWIGLFLDRAAIARPLRADRL